LFVLRGVFFLGGVSDGDEDDAAVSSSIAAEESSNFSLIELRVFFVVGNVDTLLAGDAIRVLDGDLRDFRGEIIGVSSSTGDVDSNLSFLSKLKSHLLTHVFLPDDAVADLFSSDLVSSVCNTSSLSVYFR